MRLKPIAALLFGLACSPLPAADLATTLEQYQGKVVYLDFWASWCSPCKKSFPWMQEMQSRYGNQGLQVVAVSVDESEADMKKFLATQAVDFAVVHDPKGTLAQSYALVGMPSSFLLDRNGTVVARHVGFNAASAAEYEAGIAAQLGRAVPNPLADSSK